MVGSSKVCERVTTPIPSNAIISWQDGDGTFYLRERVQEDLLLPEDGSKTGLVHEGGTSAAVWSIGVNAFCKVKAWREGMELESKTIEFVRARALEIPVPEVIRTWIDHSWNRTFLILRRVKGQTLDEEWPRLTSYQRLEIANKIGAYCCKLASISASRFETATGHAVVEPFLNDIADASHPSWIPRPIGPFSSESFASHLCPHPTCSTESTSHWILFSFSVFYKHRLVQYVQRFVVSLRKPLANSCSVSTPLITATKNGNVSNSMLRRTLKREAETDFQCTILCLGY